VSCATPGAHGAILVVDDEFAFRDILAQVMRDEGYRVAVAANGAEALEAMGRERPALILLDLMMPGVDGIDVLTTMGRTPSLANVPVLVITAADVSVHKRLARVVGTMRKPINLHSLVQKVEQLLRRGPGSSDAAPRLFR
jgi:DNA-binding response OmpR family regulator